METTWNIQRCTRTDSKLSTLAGSQCLLSCGSTCLVNTSFFNLCCWRAVCHPERSDHEQLPWSLKTLSWACLNQEGLLGRFLTTRTAEHLLLVSPGSSFMLIHTPAALLQDSMVKQWQCSLRAPVSHAGCTTPYYHSPSTFHNLGVLYRH